MWSSFLPFKSEFNMKKDVPSDSEVPKKRLKFQKCYLGRETRDRHDTSGRSDSPFSKKFLSSSRSQRHPGNKIILLNICSKYICFSQPKITFIKTHIVNEHNPRKIVTRNGREVAQMFITVLTYINRKRNYLKNDMH